MVIVALLGAGAWWAWQAYPAWFGQGVGNTRVATAPDISEDMLGETLPEAETGVAGEAAAEAEPTLPAASGEPALTPEEAEVARLLAAAEADMKARRLTSPAGNNAWEKYQQILESSHPLTRTPWRRHGTGDRELYGVVRHSRGTGRL